MNFLCDSHTGSPVSPIGGIPSLQPSVIGTGLLKSVPSAIGAVIVSDVPLLNTVDMNTVCPEIPRGASSSGSDQLYITVFVSPSICPTQKYHLLSGEDSSPGFVFHPLFLSCVSFSPKSFLISLSALSTKFAGVIIVGWSSYGYLSDSLYIVIWWFGVFPSSPFIFNMLPSPHTPFSIKEIAIHTSSSVPSLCQHPSFCTPCFEGAFGDSHEEKHTSISFCTFCTMTGSLQNAS